jgi:DNA-binding CsgD family transcriptional regulator
VAVQRAAESTFLEREDEMRRAWDFLATVPAGAGGVLAAVGEPGIGKTALLRAIAAGARERGMRVLWARGSQFEREFPFSIARQLFEPLVRGSGAAERDRLLSDAAGLAAPIVVPEAPPTTTDELFSALHGLHWLAVNASERDPLLLVVDDVHWADAESIRFLAFLAARVEGIPIGIVLAARATEPGTDAEALTALLEDSHALVIRPSALSEQAVAVIARLLLREDPEPAFIAGLARATGGNPLLLREVLALLDVAAGAPTASNAHRVDELGPPAIARAVLVRIGRMESACAQLVRALAILGPAADLPVASQLAGLDAATAARAADALVGAEVLRAGEHLEFMHPILRAAVHEDMPPLQRAQMHRRAADLLHARDAGADAIAGHLLAAPPAADRWVVEVLMTAAERATQRGAADAPVTYLRRALAEPPSDERLPEVLLALGLALGATREPEFVEVLERAVKRARSPAQAVAAAVAATRALGNAGLNDAAVKICEAAEPSLPGAPADERLLLAAELAINARQRPATRELAQSRIDEGLAAAVPGTPPHAFLRIVGATMDTLEAAPAQRSLATVEEHLGTVVQEHSLAIACALLTFLWNERPDRAREISGGVVDWARKRGAVSLASQIVLWRAAADLRVGRIDEALVSAQDSDEYNTQVNARLRASGVPAGTGTFWTSTFLISALLERGDLAAAEQVQARSELADPGDSLAAALFVEARARLRLAQGRYEEGLVHLRAATRRWEALQIVHPEVAAWRVEAARALAALGDRDEARRLADEHLRLARRVGPPGIVGRALAACGIAAGGDDGVELLRGAVAQLERSPARLDHARALVDLGAALRRGGHRRDCREPLNEGMTLARRGGAIAIARRAYDELRAAGAQPRKLLRSGVEALTPSERRIAQMAADGHTNKEIAQLLFVTVKTVEFHLRQAYLKLDVAGRQQLPTALRD